MEIGELIWLFNPPVPVNDAKLVSIGLKLPEASELVQALREEIERHSEDGLWPGHWSERQRTWFINPDIWCCVHHLLFKRGIKIFNLETYMVLNSIGHSTDIFYCQQHPETYVLWLCEVWEEVLDKYKEREIQNNQDFTWIEDHRKHLNEMRDKWTDAANANTRKSSENWLDEFEDEINNLYSRLQNSKPKE